MKIYYIKVSIQLISVSASLKIISYGMKNGCSSLMGWKIYEENDEESLGSLRWRKIVKESFFWIFASFDEVYL